MSHFSPERSYSVRPAASGGDDDSGGGDKAAAKYDGKPVTITLWTGFSDRELNVIKGVVADFHKQNPKITVKVLGSVDDDKIIAAARGGNSPDVAHSFSTDNTGAFCSSGAWIKLQPYMDRDGLTAGAFPESVQSYTKFEGNQCTLPMLADVYGLYYNKDLLAKAGIKEPPKTFSELAADAKKLTQRSSDGAIEVAGYVPDLGLLREPGRPLRAAVRRALDRRPGQVVPLERPGLDQDAQVEQGARRLVRLRQPREVPGRRGRRVLRAERLRAREDRDDDRRRVPDRVHRERAPGPELRHRARWSWTTTSPTCTAAAT